MPNWISITTDTLNEASIAALIEACSSAAKATGQDDRAPGLIQGRVDEIRAAVVSNPANQWDSDETTIPKSLKRIATTLIVADLKKAIGNALTEDERIEVASAERKLRDVSAGKLVVEQPDTAAEPTVQGGPQVELISSRTRVASREGMSSL